MDGDNFDIGADDTVLSVEDFWADMKSRMFMYVPARELWPAASVDARIPPVILRDERGNAILDEKGKPKTMLASRWLATYRPVEQLSWVPGSPLIVRDKLINLGGWVEHPGASVFNLYRPPTIKLGDASKAGPFLDHIDKVYPSDAGHITKWFAHRRQRPGEKINHALVRDGCAPTAGTTPRSGGCSPSCCGQPACDRHRQHRPPH